MVDIDTFLTTLYVMTDNIGKASLPAELIMRFDTKQT